MAILSIPDQGTTLSQPTEIREYLNQRGIWFDQWEAQKTLSDEASQETILEAYAHVLQPYMDKNGYRTADVINVHPQTENLQALKDKFKKEHIHSEDEVRFFVDGEGYFWFNLGNGEPVFYVLCQRGDLISVPAGTPHWFTMGEPPRVKAIRIFIDQSGWVPEYTATGIEEKYRA